MNYIKELENAIGDGSWMLSPSNSFTDFIERNLNIMPILKLNKKKDYQLKDIPSSLKHSLATSMIDLYIGAKLEGRNRVNY